MVRLLYKSLVLLLPFLLLAGYTEYRLRQLPNSYTFKMSRLHEQGSTIRLLILGSSHADHGIDPEQFSLPSFNMANASQSLYYDLQILQSNLNRLDNLRVAVLPVSYFSLESPAFPVVEDWRCFFYQRFYNIPLPKEVHDRYSIISPVRYSHIALYGFPQSRRFLLKNFRNTNLAGRLTPAGWHPVDDRSSAAISPVAGKKRATYHQAGMSPANLPANSAYLAAAITVLQKKGVTPVLVTLPVYETYFRHIDPPSYNRMITELESLSHRFGVPYLNYLSDLRFTREDFFDNDHLNRAGALKFTKLLDREVTAAIAGSGP